MFLCCKKFFFNVFKKFCMFFFIFVTFLCFLMSCFLFLLKHKRTQLQILII